ncbi:DUF550 domain-containing protein [Salmonella enterica subsp. diarizonae serovar 58:r:z53]
MTTITNNKLTDETLKAWKIEAMISLGETPKDCREYSHHEAIFALVTELQERRKADSDPVGEFYEDGTLNWYQISDGDRVPANRRIPLYRHAQPVPEREQIRREHAEWSDATFGDVGPIGLLKHLSKEALEAAAEQPGDLSEWADMQFLLWDAQRRAGISDEQITQAMVEKLAVNKQREWPEPKDGEPRLHIKEQPAPVVPDGLRQALSNAGIAAPESDEMLAATCEKYIQMLVTWVKDRKPFQPVPVVPEEITDESTEQRLMGRRWAHSFCAGWNACRAAMLKGDTK